MKENNSNKRRIVLALILVATITIGILATTAYFITQGRVEEERLTVKTGTLALTFEDNDDGVNEQLVLGETVTKEFIIRNTGNQPVTTNMLFDSLVNTYLEESLSYKLEYKTAEPGDWTTVTTTSHTHVPFSPNMGTYNLAEDLTIPASGVYYYRLTIKFESLDINQEKDREARLTTKFKLGDEVIEPVLSASEMTLARMGLKSQGVKSSFDTLATADETADGLYSMADDYGTSYYYRGAATNNYVKFGGFYWRIIRINGDGSVRMIYDGTKAHTNGETADENDRFIQTDVAYNGSYDDNAYVGWMYGTPGSSDYANTHTVTKSSTSAPLKTKVDEWYKTNIADENLGQYVSDEIFCNDRSMPGTSGWSDDTKLGYGTNVTAYGATGRFVDVGTGLWLSRTNPQPKFTCTNKNDAFTVSDTTKGNGSLSYPVGLITADEIVAAGAKYYKSDGTSNNTSYYLYRNKWYWSLSPFIMYTDGGASVFFVGTFGDLGSNYVSGTGAVAPVINISADYAKTLVGNGTTTVPYQIPGIE